MNLNLVLLGPPGAGKGTLANLIKEKYGVRHISTGDILREEMKSDSLLGREVKGYVDSGKLVPDEIVTKIIENRLTRSGEAGSGCLFDGFPRTTHQAEDLDKILAKINKPIESVLYMESTLPVIIQRLTGRRVCKNCGAVFHTENRPPRISGTCDACCGALYQRPDDSEGTIKTRMDVYLKNTTPIVTYYEKEGKLQRLRGDTDSRKLFDQLIKIWNEPKKSDHNKVS